MRGCRHTRLPDRVRRAAGHLALALVITVPVGSAAASENALTDPSRAAGPGSGTGPSQPLADRSLAQAPPATGTAPPAITVEPLSESKEAPAFPLTVRTGHRYLEDRTGRPFLVTGEAAWSLIAQLRREEVDLYLRDRRARGFNTLLVSLIEHRFATNAPVNAYGEPPFLVAGDYATPNERYFAHVDWVLARARDEGFLVLLAPSYMGFDGGPEGWYREMVANGPAKLRAFGRYLGRRYRDLPNILWVAAGDYDPPKKELARALAAGIGEEDGRALQTAHGAPETAALDYWQGEPWLRLNTVYTYGPVATAACAQYTRPERMPFILIESRYENEPDHGDARRMRRQAYQALLCGAAGQVFGNNPIWHFDGPGLYPAPEAWEDALGSAGARSMTAVAELMGSLRWWTLEPDIEGMLLIDGRGPEDARAVAAQAADGSAAILYLPDTRNVTVDLGRLRGERVTASWYDPRDGRLVAASAAPPPAAGRHVFTPPSSQSAPDTDWVLLLKAGG